jgi:hypothetical protein
MTFTQDIKEALLASNLNRVCVMDMGRVREFTLRDAFTVSYSAVVPDAASRGEVIRIAGEDCLVEWCASGIDMLPMRVWVEVK